MQYKIIGQTVPAVEIVLKQGESIYTQSGGMTWQTDGLSMETNTRGGFMKGLARMFAGESMFLTTYSAKRDNVMIAFAASVPGNILPYDLTGKPDLIIQKGAFLCAQPTADLRTTFTKRFGAGFLGGEGFILQVLSGDGYAFLEVDGDMVQKTLAPGEVLKVDTGNVVGFESTVAYEVETVKGIANNFFGGEGMFLTRLVGPGHVILQTQNFGDLASRVISMMPQSSNN